MDPQGGLEPGGAPSRLAGVSRLTYRVRWRAWIKDDHKEPVVQPKAIEHPIGTPSTS
jgi:hypothetical protein